MSGGDTVGGAGAASVIDKLKAELDDKWDEQSAWRLSGSIDLKDKGAEIDIEHSDPPEYNDDDTPTPEEEGISSVVPASRPDVPNDESGG